MTISRFSDSKGMGAHRVVRNPLLINPRIDGPITVIIEEAPTLNEIPPDNMIYIWYTINDMDQLVTNYKISNGMIPPVAAPVYVTRTIGDLSLNSDISSEQIKNMVISAGLNKSDVELSDVTNDAQVKRSEMGTALGVATLDSEGKLIQQIAASKIIGVLDIDNIPSAALERITRVADDTARYALTIDDVQNGDTVKVLSTGTMYQIFDDTKLNSADGYILATTESTSNVVNFLGTFTSANSAGFVWSDNSLAITHGLDKKVVDVNITTSTDEPVNYALIYTSTTVVTVVFPISVIPITATYTCRIK